MKIDTDDETNDEVAKEDTILELVSTLRDLDDELKECPFCGKKGDYLNVQYEGEMLEKGEIKKYWVECDYCGCIGPYSYDEDQTIEQWNERKGNCT